ncbi:GIY-YIG nuclease family protein [Uruburuella testudinis]|uniref:GIY-YIG nuclease family protein n=1 Tax=Uruburuella testudinis TaxID=1282863 RepID=A0ABY4DPJ8_9NEIS|nr:GIY-YIG nuclease family protein [Uruburuella testudinis]UOO80971.1 GIY-YIG nuclease family protein [Uruburuella testudinis]
MDDIWEDDDLGLLADVKPKIQHDARHQTGIAQFAEVNDFFRRHQRRPSESSGDFQEELLAKTLQSLCRDGECAEMLKAYDEFGLLNIDAAVISLADIFDDDDLDLLDAGNIEIFDFTHISEQQGKAYADEGNAERRECVDFWRFEALFQQTHAALKAGRAHLERLKTEQNLQKGELFLLGGQLCYIADVVEAEARKSNRAQFRLRLIYENATESNILMRSLARAVYKDPNGRKVMMQKPSENGDLLSGDPCREEVTGWLYVAALTAAKPELAGCRHVHKIGFTTTTVAARLAESVNDIAFLESEVKPVLAFECRNINPHTFERLLHTFFYGQRLNITLTAKNGQSYRPHEWFDVPLASIEEAAGYIAEGTINRYRVDQTTGRIVAK